MKAWARAWDVGRWVCKLEAADLGPGYQAVGIFMDTGTRGSRKLKVGVQVGPWVASGEVWRRHHWPNRVTVKRMG